MFKYVSRVFARTRFVVVRVYNDAMRDHTLQMAAALAYYLVLSLFPGLIVLSVLASYLPVPNLFSQTIDLMSRFMPADTMGIVRRVLSDIISPNRGAFLSLGLIGTLWTASGGFTAAIEACGIAYEVEDNRPFWKVRLLAIALAMVTEALLLLSLSVLIVGPRFGEWLAQELHLSWLLARTWPYIQWCTALAFSVIAVEIFYYYGPNVKQRFRATLPGAVLSVGCWICLSYLLGIYFRHFANFNKTYGTLGAAIALMMTLYWTSFAVLIGAHLNSVLAKLNRERIRPKIELPKAA